MPDKPEIKDFIQQNESLFWWVKPEERTNISINAVIEAVLNYGDEKSVKKLFDLVDIKTVADIFDRQISGKRSNYRKRTQNYFKLYFEKHA
jgi:ABC-type nitrate/sulfonate/bicarbonate transport system ATPase subunit